jgi:integrase
MRIRLKGINSVRKRLADGSTKTFYYAWKGGPPLRGDPGTPEFVGSYNEAVARKREVPRGSLLSMLQQYQQSDAFQGLAVSTRRSYVALIQRIELRFSDFPLAALSDPRTRGVFMKWRDDVAAASGRRQADYAWTVLARVLSWAFDRGLVSSNPCKSGGRLYRGGSRVDNIWTADDEGLFLTHAPEHLHLALLLALWTGQRQGDLLRLPWSAYDGTHIRLRQSKGGRRVLVPVGAPLKAALDAVKPNRTAAELVNPETRPRRPSLTILATSEGTSWTSDGFRASWAKACARAGIRGLTFHDLRGTAVTRLALSGCTEAEIATITGHSLQGVRAILDTHYLARDPALGESAIRKLEKGTKTPN